MSCGVGRRHGLDLVLLWLWHRPVAVALIWPLVWKPSYAVGVALKCKKTNKIDESMHGPVDWDGTFDCILSDLRDPVNYLKSRNGMTKFPLKLHLLEEVWISRGELIFLRQELLTFPKFTHFGNDGIITNPQSQEPKNHNFLPLLNEADGNRDNEKESYCILFRRLNQ